MAPTRRAGAPKPAAAAGGGPPRILKKYPNRRLYDTEVSTYITLAEVKTMVLDGTVFEVRDARSGEDLTRSILLQIILEEESGGVPIFSTTMLSQIIRFYGHAMQGMMGSYLERNLQAFTEMQTRLAEQSKGLYGMGGIGAMGGMPGIPTLADFVQMQEQLARQASQLFPALTPALTPTPTVAPLPPPPAPARKPAKR